MKVWARRMRNILSYEVIFALFLFSGTFKAASYFNELPIDLTLLLGVILVVATVILFIQKKVSFSVASLWIVGLYVLFVGYAAVTGVWSPSEEYYMSKTFRLGTVTAIALGVPAVIIASSRQRIRRLGGATMAISFIIAVETVRQFLLDGPWELTIFGTNYLIAGRVIGFGIIIGFYYILIERPGWKRSIPVGLITLVMVGALGFSGARGPLIAAFGAIGLIMLIGLVIGTLPRSGLAVAAYATSAIGTLSGIFLVADEIRGVRRIIALAEEPGSSLGTRFEYWLWTVNHIGEANVVRGYGLGSWPIYAGFADEQQYPHNIILEVLFETGMVGLLVFVALIGYATYSVLLNWRRSGHTESLALLVLFSYMIVNAFLSGDLNENRFLFAIIGLMAYAPGRQIALSQIEVSTWRLDRVLGHSD